MWDTWISIYRLESDIDAGNPVAQHVFIRIEQVGDQQALTHQRLYGTDVRVIYALTTYGWNPTALVRQDDFVVDETQVDPDTGLNVRMRITGRPRNAVGDHQELRGEVVVGN